MVAIIEAGPQNAPHLPCGEVAERLIARAWKARLQQCNGGSNPPLSAISSHLLVVPQKMV